MHFVLIRHAQSENNRLWAETGTADFHDPDPGLSPLGERQARALARDAELLPWRPTHVYASLMSRAIATAAPFADALDLPVLGHELLHEVGGPYVGSHLTERVAHAGAGRATLAALSPRLVLPDAAGDDGWFPGPLEAIEDALTRAEVVVTALRERHAADDVVALFTHGWFTQKLLRTLLGGQERAWFTVHNTGVSVVADAREGMPCPVEVRCLNSTRHLPYEWLTE